MMGRSQVWKVMSPKILRILVLASLCEGVAGLAWLMANPSKQANARLLGYSYLRLGLAGGVVVILGVLAALAWGGIKYAGLVDRYLRDGDHLYFIQTGLLAGVLNAMASFVFSWLFIPPNLRPVIAWAGLIFLQSWLAVAFIYCQVYRQKDFSRRYRLLPAWSDLEQVQKKVLLVLLGLGLIYFALFIPLNLTGANDEHTFSIKGGDEYVIYPVVTTMYQPGETFSGTLYHIFIYEDYHYGYPFYALSALTLLPVRLAAGPQFIHLTQVNLLLLRQFVSVLPIILAALVLVYLATRFRKLLAAAGLFTLILSIPGVVRYNHNFWHPDGLNLLFIVLTLYFLDRDRLHFGRNFYLAAVACGLSVATRLYGFFFFLAIAAYLLVGLARRSLSRWQVFGKAGLFAGLMVITILFSDPFLFSASARANLVRIMHDKRTEMVYGYNQPDPQQIYRSGWAAWLPFFEEGYAANFFSIFLLASLIVGTWLGGQDPQGGQGGHGQSQIFNGMLLAWVIVLAGYLVYFVAVKSSQYMLPLFVPFYAASFSIPVSLEGSRFPAGARKSAWGLAILACLAQFTIQIVKLPFFLR
jgi:hypothetical protein